jgi:peroxidase
MFQIALATVHTIWTREHNRIAIELRYLHGDWDDEILYQETRRIVVAEYQHIVYNEWLPIIIGRRYMEVFNILPYSEGYYTGHDVVTEPTISNAFATAAFRLHTLVSGWFE